MKFQKREINELINEQTNKKDGYQTGERKRERENVCWCIFGTLQFKMIALEYRLISGNDNNELGRGASEISESVINFLYVYVR